MKWKIQINNDGKLINNPVICEPTDDREEGVFFFEEDEEEKLWQFIEHHIHAFGNLCHWREHLRQCEKCKVDSRYAFPAIFGMELKDIFSASDGWHVRIYRDFLTRHIWSLREPRLLPVVTLRRRRHPRREREVKRVSIPSDFTRDDYLFSSEQEAWDFYKHTAYLCGESSDWYKHLTNCMTCLEKTRQHIKRLYKTSE